MLEVDLQIIVFILCFHKDIYFLKCLRKNKNVFWSNVCLQNKGACKKKEPHISLPSQAQDTSIQTGEKLKGVLTFYGESNGSLKGEKSYLKWSC